MLTPKQSYVKTAKKLPGLDLRDLLQYELIMRQSILIPRIPDYLRLFNGTIIFLSHLLPIWLLYKN